LEVGAARSCGRDEAVCQCGKDWKNTKVTDRWQFVSIASTRPRTRKNSRHWIVERDGELWERITKKGREEGGDA
jgi:hypothetical protein